MAQRTRVELIDDLDASSAGETVDFGLDGIGYQIDLSVEHAQALRAELAPYRAAARRVARATGRQRGSRSGRGSAGRSAGGGAGGGGAGIDREQNRAMRRWAHRHGYRVSERGRLPAAVIDAYQRGQPPAASDHSTRTRTDGPAGNASAAGAQALAGSASDREQAVGLDGLTPSERERIRSWAQSQGIEVKSRGRLTKDLIANYRATTAHTGA